MASGQPGYPPQGQGQYEQEAAQPYDGGAAQPAYDQQAAPAAGPKKKRAYAGQAFEFGVGANAAGQQPPAGGVYAGAQPAAYGYGPQQGQPMGYQQPGYGDAAAQVPQAPGVGAPYAQPGYGAPAPSAYQAPEAAYPAHGATSMLQGGVTGVTQQFSQMGMGMSQQPPAPAQAVPAMRLNPLQPVDISAQGAPFNVADLDLPPPPIILPPNVCTAQLKVAPDLSAAPPPAPSHLVLILTKRCSRV